MDKQKSELRDALKTIGFLVLMLLFISFGFVFGRDYESCCPKTIEGQHEKLMLENDYIYCPYCGAEMRGAENE